MKLTDYLVKIKEPNIEEKFLNHTPLQKYEYQGKIIYVKREDLVANPPAPPFAKLRGLITFISNEAKSCDYIGALEPSTNSMYGVGVAWACNILKKKAIVYYPKYKHQNNEARLNYIKAKEMGAIMIPLEATKVSIVFYRARKHLQENYPNSFLVPNGFKGCDELVDATAKEVDTMPEKLFNKNITWILSCGTGSITSGVIKGLIKNASQNFPQVKLHLAFDRSEIVVLDRIKKFNSLLTRYGTNIEIINEKYQYGKKYSFDNIWKPVPMNIDYEIKAWKWLMNNLDKVEKTIVFWNMGSSLEEQEQRKAKVEYMSMIKGGEKEPYEVFTKPVPHIVKSLNIPVRGWYKSKHESTNIRPRPCYSEHILTSPYSGFCMSNCAWCYVNNGVRGWRSTGMSVVDPEYPDKVRKAIDKLKIAFTFYISSFTESFNRLEPIYHVTQNLAQVAVDNNLPILFCTRQRIPDWAIEQLKQNPYSYIQWSINLSNEEDWRKLTPGCPSLPELYENIKKVGKEGIYTSFQVNPILYGITMEEDLIKILDKAKELGVKHLIFKFVEIVYNSKENLINKLRTRLKNDNRVNIFEKYFTQSIGGVITIREDIRKKVLDMLQIETKKRELTMGLCYEYEKNFIHKAGVSLGSKYTSEGSQCHGRPIPIFYRHNLKDKFKPLENCYGMCLYCNEAGTKACNNDILLQAKALKYSDLLKLEIKNE